MSSEIKWLCIGTGDIVRKRAAAALATTPGGALVGVCGGRERAAAIAGEHGAAEVFDDFEKALRDTRANAVYIGTSVHRHAEAAIRAAELGKHILVEKPLGLDAADARRIADAAAKAGVTAGCAYYRRCFPRYQHLKKLVDVGELGRIVLVRTVNCAWFSPSKDDPKYWRVDKSQSGGGPLADVGSHMFDLIVGLFGLPASIFAHCDTLVQDYTVEDSASVVMKLNNGAHVTGSFGWSTKTWAHEFEVVGSEARVRWSPADVGKVIHTVGRDTRELDLPSHENVHAPLVADFNEAVRLGRPPICPVAEAVKTNQVLDAIYQSSTAGGKVTP